MYGFKAWLRLEPHQALPRMLPLRTVRGMKTTPQDAYGSRALLLKCRADGYIHYYHGMLIETQGELR